MQKTYKYKILSAARFGIYNFWLKSIIYDKIYKLAHIYFITGIMLAIFSLSSSARILFKPDLDLLKRTDTSFVINIHGTVIDENNDPVTGATLLVKGTSKATITNSAGKFALFEVEPNATIIASDIGLKTVEVKINGRSNLTIRMEINTHTLGGVSIVSTGYQSIPKERATGSFTYINNKLFNEQVSPDILSRLPTVANGLTINNKINNGQLSIRGLSTINSPMDPLIIVDNFPYQGDISNINPNDVESITLLKDAAASSIWGAKAGNGVIVITTKKGRLNQPLTVEVNSNITIGEKPDLFYLKNIPTSDYIDVEKFLFDQQYRFSDTANDLRPPFSKVYEMLFQARNGQITQQQADYEINALRGIDDRNEFLKYMYQKSVNQQYNINMHGGSNNATYYFSAGFDNNLDNLDAGYKRLTLKFENTYRPIKNLQVTTGLYFINSNTTSGRPGYGQLSVNGGATNAVPPYFELVDANGNAAALALKFRQPYIDTLGEGKLLDWNYYPLTDWEHSRTKTAIQDITGDFGINYKIVKGLNIDIKYQYERQTTTGRTLYDQESFYARDMINLYSEIDPNSGQITYNVPMGGILNLSTNQLTSQNIRGQLNFDKTWAKNNIVAMGGAEIAQVNSEGNSYTTYGYDDDILTYSDADFNDYFPTLIGYGGFIPDGKDFSGTMNRAVSVYANAAYTYNDKYILSVSGRRDGSNLFGATTKNKWKPLWSSGASWIISKEDFFDIPFIQYLKLRATYGSSGNTNPSESGITTLGILDVSPYTNGIKTTINSFYNPELRWENVHQLDVGFDFYLLNDRISGNIDYYVKKATDLIAPVPVDFTTGLGVSTVDRNVGILKTSGFDIGINTLNIDKKFRWSTTLNLNTNRDKVMKYNTTTNTDFAVNSGFVAQVGKPVYGVYSYKWAGLDPETGAPRGYLDGKVSEDYQAITASSYSIDDLVYNGPKLPTLFGSMGNTVSWKHISISVWLTYKFHYFFRRQSINYSSLFNGYADGNYDYVNRWQKPGDEQHTNVPSMIYPASGSRDDFYDLSEALIDRGDNIRIQYINLSYEVSQKEMKALPFKSVKIYAYLNNVGIIWRANKDRLDPDYLAGAIPPPRTITFGIAAGF